MANNQITPFQLTDQFTMDNFNQRINETNTALQNNNPRNWGLGSMDGKMLTTDDDLDNIIINGWYSWSSSSPTNAPVQYGRMILFGYSNTVTQIVSSDMPGWKNILVMRSRFQGTWSPWEYINPPMEQGKEYRTTERHNGKPVYALAFDFGALPNSDIKNVTIPKWTSHNIVFDLKITAHSSNETIPVPTGLSSDYASSYWFISTTSALFHIRSKSDLSKYSSCVVTLKYTKTTD